MTEDPYTFIYLPGAGGCGGQELTKFSAGLDYQIQFETISYPGWQSYIDEDFSANSLIGDLANEVVRRVPNGPIRLMGMSIGGHFGYATALRLREMGREIAVFCVIDSFMMTSSEALAGWKTRALADAFALLKKGRFSDFSRLVQSKAWRAVLRLAGGRLVGQLRKLSAKGQVPAMFRNEGIAEQELSMRLLLRQIAPWVAGLDRNPVALDAPAILLRTEDSIRHDAAWRRRCPDLSIREIPGKHLTLFEPENIGGLRDAFVSAMDELASCLRTETP